MRNVAEEYCETPNLCRIRVRVESIDIPEATDDMTLEKEIDFSS